MIALLVGAAFAQDTAAGVPFFDTAAEDCDWVSVSESLPQSGAPNVPVDVQPTLVFVGTCGSPSYEITVSDAATSTVLATMTWSLPDERPAMATLVPTAPLPFDTDLVLSATASDGVMTAWIPFHTAEAEVEPLRGTLAIDVLEASFVAGDVADTVTATVRVTAIQDPAALSLLELTGPNGVAWYDPTTLGEPLVLTWTGAAADEACFEAVQLDGRGNELGPARDCAPITGDRTTGCGCDGTRAPVGLGAIGLLLLFRRRKPCSS